LQQTVKCDTSVVWNDGDEKWIGANLKAKKVFYGMLDNWLLNRSLVELKAAHASITVRNTTDVVDRIFKSFLPSIDMVTPE
jgi:hypothetical protein